MGWGLSLSRWKKRRIEMAEVLDTWNQLGFDGGDLWQGLDFLLYSLVMHTRELYEEWFGGID